MVLNVAKAFRSARVAGMALIVAGFAAQPALADLIADTGSGTTPSAFSAVMVNASTFAGNPAIANGIVIGPQDLLFQTQNTYNSSYDLELTILINGAYFDVPTFGMSVAGLNADGTIGDFYTPAGVFTSALNTVGFVANIIPADTLNFIRLTGVNFYSASDLATPGSDITLSFKLTDYSGQTTYETSGPTAVVTSVDVPTPGSWMLLGFGLLALGAVRRTAKAS